MPKTPKHLAPTFVRTTELYNEMADSGDFGDHFQILSMGMSNDFEVAIECGSNVVRVGRGLFGDNAEPEED